MLNIIQNQFDLVSLSRPLVYIANPPFSMDTGVGLAQVMVRLVVCYFAELFQAPQS